MSVWTHVAGIIRYDDLRSITPESLLLFKYKKALGITCDFEDSEEMNELCNVPCGTEGSLQWNLTENPHIDDLAAYIVTIWGDLRDYDDLDEIKAWFERCVIGEHFLVRNAVLHAKVEYGPERIWVIESDQDCVRCVWKNETD